MNNLKQFARPEEWSKVRLNKVRQLSCIIERREEGASSIAPLLANCQNVEELSVSVVVRYNSFAVLDFFFLQNMVAMLMVWLLILAAIAMQAEMG